MQIRFTVILTVLIAAFIVCSFQPVNAAKEGRTFIAPVVVEVNGEPIYEQELLYFLIGRYGQDVLSELIENAILAGKASEYNITVDKDLPRQEMIENYGQDKYQELSKAFDIDKILGMIRVEHLATGVYDAMVDKIKKENSIEISERDALDYYLKNVDNWSRPAMVRFSIIVTKNKSDADKAKAELDGGTKFEDAAKKYSVDKATKDAGGDMAQMIPQGYFRGPLKKIEDTLFSVPINTHSDIINVDENYFIVMPTERAPALEKKFNEVKDYIVDTMTAEKVAPFMKERLGKLRDDSKTEIYYPIFDIDNKTEKGFVKVDKLPPPTGKYIVYPIVVKVNGTPIYEQEMIFKLLSEQYGEKLLQELIENMIFYQQAKQMGVTIEKDAAQKVLENTYGADKLASLEKSFDMDKVRTAIERELMGRKALVEKKDQLVKEKGISIPEADARKFYDGNKDRYIIPERVRFSIIVTEKQDDAQTAENEIKGGSSFADVAKKYSIDRMTIDNGGDIGTMWPRGMFEGPFVELEDKIFALNVDQVSDPIFIQDRFYIVKLTEKASKDEKSFDDVKDSIINNMVYVRVYPFLSTWLDELSSSVKLNMAYPIFGSEEKVELNPSTLKDAGESKAPE